jgi:hypothetical protein
MNDGELEQFENELRRTPPARPPEDFLARLTAAKLDPQSARWGRPEAAARASGGWGLWRWLAPAMAVAVAGLLVMRENVAPEASPTQKPLAAANGLKADNVQVDEELVSSYEVVANLPGGEPVRFRCRKWRDQLVVTDKNSGLEIEKISPRVEVMPVRFETY